MLNIIGADMRSGAPAATSGNQAGLSGVQGIFARLLAGSAPPPPTARDTAPAAAARTVAFPGDPDTQADTRNRLRAALDSVLDWARDAAASAVPAASPDNATTLAPQARPARGLAGHSIAPGPGDTDQKAPAGTAAVGIGLAGGGGESLSVTDGDTSVIQGLMAFPGDGSGAGSIGADPGQAQTPQAGARNTVATAAVATNQTQGSLGAPLSANGTGANVNEASLPSEASVPRSAAQANGQSAIPAPSGGLPFATLLADRLGTTLQRFDAAQGTDTQAVLAENAATLPALTLMPGDAVESATAIVSIVRGLLGLEPQAAGQSPVLVSSAPVLTRVPGAQSLTSLVARIVAPAGITDPGIPEGRGAEALRMPVPATQRAKGAGPTGLIANLAAQLRGLAAGGETARLRLSPPGLGSVQVTVFPDAQPQGGILVQADNPHVLAALRAAPEQVAGLLREAGFPAQAVSLTFQPIAARSARPGAAPLATGSGEIGTTDGPSHPAAASGSLAGLERLPLAGPRAATHSDPLRPVAALAGTETLAAPEPAGPSHGPMTMTESRVSPVDLLAARPVETAAATQQAAPQGHLAHHVAAQLRAHRMAEGTTRIGLTPQGLGSLEIDLARDESGALRIIIRAENPAVLGALRENREALLTVLRDGGTAVQDSGLGFEDYGRGGRQQQRAEPFEQAQAFLAPEEESTEPALFQKVLPDGQVDIIT